MAIKPYQPPVRRLPTNSRPFEQVVRDMRYAVFSVVRARKIAGSTDQHVATALGSGFFVAPEVFLTACHVMNATGLEHQDGDSYHLVRNDGPNSVAHFVLNVGVGKTLHLFPDCDMALLQTSGVKNQAYVALDYADWPVGKEIGVAGYPLARLHAVNGALAYDGLIFRVARDVITAAYQTTITTNTGQVMPNVPVLEVNFLFVPGNSGGPIFDAETGRVAAFVHGYNAVKIRERVEQITTTNLILPNGLPNQYIENLNAVYSLAVRISRCRDHLTNFNVNL